MSVCSLNGIIVLSLIVNLSASKKISNTFIETVVLVGYGGFIYCKNI